MRTQISPMLAVRDGNAAIDFFKAAFGAELLWHLGEGQHVVAGLSIDGAKSFLAHESPRYGTQGPNSVGFTTVRIELFVDDHPEVHRQALAAGATERSPVVEYYETIGPKPINALRCPGGSVRSYVVDREDEGETNHLTRPTVLSDRQ